MLFLFVKIGNLRCLLSVLEILIIKKSFLIIIESVLIDWEYKGFHTFTKVFIRMGKYKI